MNRPRPSLVIDARPRGPGGPLAAERVLGRPVLAHLLDLAGELGGGAVVVHAREGDQPRLRESLDGQGGGRVRFRWSTGPTPEGSVVLRADRLYDPRRLRRALARGRDVEAAVVWRLDRPGGLAGAEAELIRRRTYQPLGRFWALGPARALARALVRTPVRPNALTAASALSVLGAAAAVAAAAAAPTARIGAAALLAVGLVLDTADGHLARLQGTASEFGRWLDAMLDELGDMTIHAAAAWSAYARDRHPGWLVLGMGYAAGKYLFVVAQQNDLGPAVATTETLTCESPGTITHLVRLAGHADVRWHLWIVLAALGRLDLALVLYAAYFPARALAGAVRRGVRRG
jgi:phosphatidylglycerophosphate synthase